MTKWIVITLIIIVKLIRFIYWENNIADGILNILMGIGIVTAVGIVFKETLYKTPPPKSIKIYAWGTEATYHPQKV